MDIKYVGDRREIGTDKRDEVSGCPWDIFCEELFRVRKSVQKLMRFMCLG